MKCNKEKKSPRQSVLLIGIIRLLNFVGRLLTWIKVPIGQFSEERLLYIAQRKTGLSDFGDERFRTPFQVLLQSYKQESQYSFVGRIAMERRLMLGLINRLLITNELKHYSEVLAVPIRRPMFIVSLPRTGTTFLHKLLAQDPHARPLLAWEGLWPARRPEDIDTDSDPRTSRFRRILKLIKFLAPQLRVMHDIDLDGPEECIPLMRNTFLMPGPMPPMYREWFLQQPAEVIESAYREYLQQLQLIQLKRPQEGHWLLKSPIHLHGIDALLKLFPDSVIIMIHRDPCRAIPSFISIVDFINALIYDNHERQMNTAAFVLNWAAEALGRAEAARKHADPGRIHDIQYENLVNDPIGTIQRFYSHAGYSFTSEFDIRIQAWLKKHPRNKYGKHHYSLEEYGLNRQMIDDAFSWYCERYRISRESPS